jgi:WhiB family transcriptional regulator, redox-sensing transcriptional regulator
VSRGVDWHESAACSRVDPDIFFPPQGKGIEYLRRARVVCDECPVQTQCLEESLSSPHEEHGIRAGLSPAVVRAMHGALHAAGEMSTCD